MMNNCAVAIFIKAPVPGRVKTRLGCHIGAVAACDLYRSMVDHAIGVVIESGLPLIICHDGSLEELPAEWLAPAAAVIKQHGDNLGERMLKVFNCLFDEGFDQALIIGSDIPGIDAACISRASAMLDSHQMVIGPALDGGYYLIGFNRGDFYPDVFENIPWSSDQVLPLTLKAASSANISVAALHPLRDMDTLDDLRILQKEGSPVFTTN